MLSFLSRWPLLGLLCAASCTAPDSQSAAPPAMRPAHRVSPPPTLPRQATRFDSLTSTRQVQRLLRTLPGLFGIRLTDSLPQPCPGTLTCQPPGRVAGWVRADFDGNGRTDLLVTGTFLDGYSGRIVRVLLDSGQRRLHPQALGGYMGGCVAAQLVRVRQQVGIRYAHQRYPPLRTPSSQLQPVCQVDTLLFHDGQLLEYNPAPRDYQIERVQYTSGACLGTCPIYTLTVAANGTATYQARAFVPRKGTFTAAVPAPVRQQLWALLNYLDFPRLQNTYAVPVTDQITTTLLITYAGGQTKTIVDYGQQGTLGLGRVYELLHQLRTSQRWQ
ncbi:MAG: DUF6438 domain-containing protein [Janthinobacterium lividum]